MEERKVFCSKLRQELRGLEKPPFKGEIGDKIFNHVSQQAWNLWGEMQIKVINEYRLNMADANDYDVLIKQMLSFLNLAEGDVVEVENADRGRGE